MTLLKWDLQPRIPPETDDAQKDLLLQQPGRKNGKTVHCREATAFFRASKNILFVGFEGSKRI